ncbi:outer membrane beta-barrel protein [Saccharophagus degradans]|uniref:Outer membrane protein beta-barrel domain-containing protein n=1 Tax=Saccharophagus degradans (strain 2-40 / ATCC 43961 / DSM 17024) TaxID=203122 RepID=Q21LY2_SACD2|nr:outer membrane beta-barrel protein [Saccharophagus degradans]ABD80297.1 hypothetical protein Sde_1035 [Saccharophagus degradans 2-40]
MNIKTSLICALFCIAGTAQADESTPTNETTTRWYGSLGRISLDDAVQQEGIDTSATSWRFGGERQTNNWLFGGGISGFLYSDNNSFSQDVENSWGSDSTADSSATAFNFYFEGGYVHPLNQNVDVALLAGIELVLSSTRGIGNCTNCYEEDIDVSSGFYIQPRITYTFENNWFMGASYNLYQGGDVNSGLSLTVGVGY